MRFLVMDDLLVSKAEYIHKFHTGMRVDTLE